MDCNLRIPTLPWILLRPTACFPLPSRYVNLLQAGRPPSQLHCRRKTFGACRLNKLLVMHINNNLKWEEQGNEWRTSIHGTFAILYAIMKRATNKCNLVCNIAAKRVGKRAFFHPCSSLSWKKSGCYNLRRWILASVWMKLCHTRSYVIYCKKRLPWVGESTSCTDFITKVDLISTVCNNFTQPAATWFVTKQAYWWVVKCATSLFKSSRNHVTKQVARFCYPFYHTLSKQLV